MEINNEMHELKQCHKPKYIMLYILDCVHSQKYVSTGCPMNTQTLHTLFQTMENQPEDITMEHDVPQLFLCVGSWLTAIFNRCLRPSEGWRILMRVRSRDPGVTCVGFRA